MIAPILRAETRCIIMAVPVAGGGRLVPAQSGDG
ncbi:DUF3117 domain-containing protein [Caulobacter sp.]